MLAGPIQVDSNGQLTVFDGSSGWSYYAQTPILVAFIMFWLSFVAHQVLSWRRPSGQRRQQLKWLLVGAVVCLTCAAISITLGSYTGIWQVLSDVFVTGLIALPAGIGVGILKYRLYEIDRIISRTLSYAIVTGLLVGVYAGLVLLTTQVFRVHTPVAVAASTLAAAALFNPCGGGSRWRWTGGSTAPATMPTRPLPHSRPASKTRSTWSRSVMTWPVSCTRPWNPPTYRCGSANATEAGFHRRRGQIITPRLRAASLIQRSQIGTMSRHRSHPLTKCGCSTNCLP
jgi:hypothetical protein